MSLFLRILVITLFLLIFSGNISFAQFIDSVSAYIKSKEIRHPEIVLKQAILETGWFRSKMLMRKNNLFGFASMKGYIRFKDWKSSVDFYKSWQDRNYKDTVEDYYLFLHRVKFTRSKNIVRNLKRIHTGINENE